MPLSPKEFAAQYFNTEALPAAILASINSLGSSYCIIHKIEDTVKAIEWPKHGTRLTHYEFFVLTDGACELEYNLQQIQQRRGQIRFSSPGALSFVKDIATDIKGYYCCFNDDFIQLASKTSLISELPFFFHSNYPIIEVGEEQLNHFCVLFDHLIQLSKGSSNLTQVKIMSTYLNAFLLECNLLFTDNLTTANKSTAAGRITKQFFELLILDYTYQDQLKDLAQKIGISAKHLTKSIKQITGFPPSYFIKKNISLQAKIKLRETNYSIGEIAYELGFEDVSYFIRFFKKQTQETPTAYRLRVRR